MATAERLRDAERKREQRAKDKNVVVPPCADRERRARLEADDVAWLMHYFGTESEVQDPFWYEFTEQQREMIAAIGHAIRFGGDQAIAASRGEGKTTIFERLLLKYTLQGVLSFSVLCASTGTLADNSLDTIKSALEENPLLAEDYPEVCIPVIALEGAPQRAGTQTVSGARHDNDAPYEMAKSRFSWCGQEIVFPNVPGSPSARAIIATRGLDSAVRGLKRKGRRVQLVGIDDPDTEDTARSQVQAKKLEDRIDRALGGLGSQQKAVARVMLTTLQSRIAVSFRYTDPQQKPTFKGKRFRYLITPPDRLDLWEEYVSIRLGELQAVAAGESADKHCRKSHAFYLENRELMDAGSIVANPHRLNAEVLPDESQVEVSSLQHYYNEVARIGQDAVDTELNNDPPEETGPQESGISEALVAGRMNGFPQATVPPYSEFAIGIDIGDHRGHFVAVAADKGACYYVIDWGFIDFLGTSPEDLNDRVRKLSKDDPERRAAIEHQIRRGIINYRSSLEENPYTNEGGEVIEPSLVLMDSGSGLHRNVIYGLHRELGKPFVPAKGFGQGRGLFRQGKQSPKRRIGEFWSHACQDDAGFSDVWLYEFDADHWKRFVHQRFLTPTLDDSGHYRKGGMSLWRSEQSHRHSKYARQVAGEVWVNEFVPGKGQKSYWDKRGANHWLDATAMACVGLSVRGTRIVGEPRRRVVKSMGEMQAKAKSA